jgi:hypothetical protein
MLLLPDQQMKTGIQFELVPVSSTLASFKLVSGFSQPKLKREAA